LLDTDAHKDRNVVERSLALNKQWRGIATRYDKPAITYRAAAVLHACITRIRIQKSTLVFGVLSAPPTEFLTVDPADETDDHHRPADHESEDHCPDSARLTAALSCARRSSSQ
jgi:hypothetical protein